MKGSPKDKTEVKQCKNPTLKLKAIITNHTDYINAICLLKNGKLASCSNDKTIKIHDILTERCELTILTNQKYGISYICELENGYFVSSSWDNTIKIWEIHKKHYQCVKTINGHNCCIKKIIPLSNNRICSSSLDKTIKVWNSNSPFSCIKVLMGHKDCVNSLLELKSKKYIVSAGWDKKLCFWNSENYELQKVVPSLQCYWTNSMTEIDEERIIVGELENFSIVNILTFQIETKIKFGGVVGSNSFSLMKNGNILCGCCNGIFVIKDYYFLKVMENAHDDSITSIVLINDSLLVTSSCDCTIKIWNLTK